MRSPNRDLTALALLSLLGIAAGCWWLVVRDPSVRAPESTLVDAHEAEATESAPAAGKVRDERRSHDSGLDGARIAAPTFPFRLVDHDTNEGIPSVTVDYGEHGAVVSKDGWLAPPAGVGWCAYVSATHGKGKVDLRAPSSDGPCLLRLRRVVDQALRLEDRRATRRALSVRLDRVEPDADRVDQLAMRTVLLSPDESVTTQLVTGRWIVDAESVCSVSPHRFRTTSEAIVVVASDHGPDAIVGRVVDTEGAPCANVDVAVVGGFGAGARTDAEGRFVLREDARNDPGGVAWLNVGVAGDTWAPRVSCGPYQKGQQGVVIKLERRLRTILHVAFGDEPLSSFDVDVRFRSVGARSRIEPHTETLAGVDGVVELPPRMHSLECVVVTATAPRRFRVPVDADALRGEDDPDRGVRHVRVRIDAVAVDVRVVDAVTQAPVAGAAVTMIETAGNIEAAAAAGSPIATMYRPSQVMASSATDLTGASRLEVVSDGSCFVAVEAAGYQRAVEDVSMDRRTLTVRLVRASPVACFVDAPEDWARWPIVLQLRPSGAHLMERAARAVVREGVARIPWLGHGDYVATVLVTLPEATVLPIPAGTIRYAGEEQRRIDLRRHRLAPVRFRNGSGAFDAGDNVAVWRATGEYFVHATIRDEAASVRLPQGDYVAVRTTRSSATGATVVRQAPFRVGEDGVLVAVDLALSGQRCEVRVLDGADTPRADTWVNLGPYGMQRSDAQGLLRFEEPVLPGTIGVRVRWSALRGSFEPVGPSATLEPGPVDGVVRLRLAD